MGGEAVDEGAADGKGRASEALRFEGGADGGPAILGGLERFGEAGCDGDVPFQLEVEAGAGDDDKVAPGTGAGDDVELLAFGGVGHGLDLDERGFQAEGVGAVVFMAGGGAGGVFLWEGARQRAEAVGERRRMSQALRPSTRKRAERLGPLAVTARPG